MKPRMHIQASYLTEQLDKRVQNASKRVLARAQQCSKIVLENFQFACRHSSALQTLLLFLKIVFILYIVHSDVIIRACFLSHSGSHLRKTTQNLRILILTYWCPRMLPDCISPNLISYSTGSRLISFNSRMENYSRFTIIHSRRAHKIIYFGHHPRVQLSGWVSEWGFNGI